MSAATEAEIPASAMQWVCGQPEVIDAVGGRLAAPLDHIAA